MTTTKPAREPSEADALAPGSDPDDQKRADIHHHLALVFGYNELARRAEKLGEKLYFRLARGIALDKLRAIGGTLQVDEDPIVLTLEAGPPKINLYEKDIEAMRAAVAAFDKSRGAQPLEPLDPSGASGFDARPK